MGLLAALVTNEEEAIGRLLREGEVLAKIAETPDASLPIQSAAESTSQIWQHYFLGIGIFLLAVLLIGVIIIFIVKKPNYFGRLLSLILLLGMAGSVPYGVWLSQQPTRLRSQAAPQTVPQNLQINQITSEGFTISWQTEIPTMAAIKVGLNADVLDQAFTDSGDSLATTHRVTSFGLNPNTIYFLEIVSGDEIFNDQGRPFRIQTQ